MHLPPARALEGRRLHNVARGSRGNAFGGSRVVQEAHESAARDVAGGGGNQEITADGCDYMVKSFESWAMFALPDEHEHKRVKAMGSP